MAATVLIVDDHSPFRAVARRLLESEGYEIVGEAGSGTSALEAAARLRPALVLIDVQLPDLDGFAVTERLAAADDPPAVVLISSRDRSAYQRRLARSAARGFIAKSDLTASAIAALVG